MKGVKMPDEEITSLENDETPAHDEGNLLDNVGPDGEPLIPPTPEEDSDGDEG